MPAVKDLILAVRPLSETKQVPTITSWPNTEGQLFVRQLSASQRELYEARLRMHIEGQPVLWKIHTVIDVLVDKDGKPIFTHEDAVKLGEGSPDPIDEVFNFWSSAFEAPTTDELKNV